MIYIALPICNISPLIIPVLDCLYSNTKTEFFLSICDNSSRDNTVELVKEYLKDKDNWELKTFPERVNAVDCINKALESHKLNYYEMVVKMDHDYGVPVNWDIAALDILNTEPKISLICPSVVPETPKGMQYYSQNHKPEMITQVKNYILYHYQGIAGYCHCFRQEDLYRLGEYRSLNSGAVFGSEDADWSLRISGGVRANAYIFNVQGHHWSKPVIGNLEDEWKGQATFLKTKLHWEDWVNAQDSETRERYGI